MKRIPEVHVSSRAQVRPSRCAYCHASGGELIACRACGTPLHAVCWKLHGRCPLLGCSGQPPEPDGGSSWPARLVFLTLVLFSLLPFAVALVSAHEVARKRGDEASAISAFDNSREVLFRDGSHGNGELGMLSELSNTGLIESVLGGGKPRSGYYFTNYCLPPPDCLWLSRDIVWFTSSR